MGKIIELKSLKKTAVHPKDLSEGMTLLRVLDAADWQWKGSSNFPSFAMQWTDKEMCLSAELDSDFIEGNMRVFDYGLREYFQEIGYRIITPEEFYRIQGLNKTKVLDCQTAKLSIYRKGLGTLIR